MEPTSESNSLKFGYYFVAFIDVLNQRDALRGFKELPRTEEEKVEFIQTAKKTFGVVDGVRGLFDEFFWSYQTPETPDRTMPKQFQQFLDKTRKADVKSQRFMDSIIIYVPLAEGKDSSPISGIYSALLACGSTFLCSLAAKHALRVGIDVGLGAELHPGEIYGPVVSEAYRLESAVADYPRIVIGQELLNYLLHKRNIQDLDLWSKVTGQMAHTCLRFFSQDLDGHTMLDYLGSGFMERGEYLLLRDGVHLKAYDFVTDQAAHWKGQKNSKLSFRYVLLQKYFDARLAMWAKS